MPDSAEPIREIDAGDPGVLSDALLTSTEPVVLRGLVARWPLVRAAIASFDSADAYLRRFYRDAGLDLVRVLAGGLWQLVQLPAQSVGALDAIGRALDRLFTGF